MSNKFYYFSDIKKDPDAKVPEGVNAYAYDLAKRFNDQKVLKELDYLVGNRAYGVSRFHVKHPKIGDYRPFFEVRYQEGVFTHVLRLDVVETESGFFERMRTFKNPVLRYKNNAIKAKKGEVNDE